MFANKPVLGHLPHFGPGFIDDVHPYLHSELFLVVGVCSLPMGFLFLIEFLGNTVSYILLLKLVRSKILHVVHEFLNIIMNGVSNIDKFDKF